VTSEQVPDTAWSPALTVSTDVPVELELPGYRDFVLIARGGQSVVYRARQEGLDRLVAIKVLAPPLPDDDARGRDVHNERWFQRELEITVRLGQAHPHIVTVLDTRLTPAGEPCIVMEYFPLGSLHDQLRALGRLPSGQVLNAGTVIADALAFAHGQGVLHRDVKPQNILVLPTSYVLTDFGLARTIDTERSDSLERVSYRHAAPQVLDGELPTEADDVYSLASTLFTLLDGRPPFASDEPGGDSALAYLRRARTGAPRRITGTDAPAELLAVIERCLAHDREDRLPDAAGLRDTLATIASAARMWAPGAAPPINRAAPVMNSAPEAADAGPARASVVTPGPTLWLAAGALPGAPSVPDRGPSPSERGPSAFDRDSSGPGRGTVYGSSYETTPGNTDVRTTDPASDEDPEPLIPWAHEDDKPRGATPWMKVEPDSEERGRPAAAEPEAEPEGRISWPRLAFRVAIALVLGGVLGLAGTVASRLLTKHDISTGQPVPTVTAAVSAPSGTGLVNDPSIAPQITSVTARGTTVEIRWTDRSGGQATFIVVEVKGETGTPIRRVDPGSAGVIIEGLDPAANRYCYQILALTGQARGVSEVECS